MDNNYIERKRKDAERKAIQRSVNRLERINRKDARAKQQCKDLHDIALNGGLSVCKPKKKKKKQKWKLAKKQQNRSISYKEYLQTRWWKKRRETKKRSVGYKCERCLSTENLQIHHRNSNYTRLWRERDKDLECLCRECHSKVHVDAIMCNNHLASISRQI